MQSTERQKFEENWKSAFDGAENSPSENVWNSIELKLAGQESAAMKKRVVFYQRLAAATVLFALLTGTYAFYTNYTKTENQLASNSVVTDKNAAENKIEDKTDKSVADENPTLDQSFETNDVKSSITKNSVTKAPVVKTPVTKTPTDAPVLITNNEGADIDEPVQESFITEAPQQQLASNDERKEATSVEALKKEETKKEIKEPVTSPLIQTAPLVASLEPLEGPKQTEKTRNRSEGTWLALGAAAGNYSPNASIAPAPQASMDQLAYAGPPTFEALDAASKANNQSKTGTAYSVGMAVGKKFGRFVVQSGINLGKQQIDYTSSYTAQDRTSNTAKATYNSMYASMSSNTLLVPTAAYTVNSSMEMVSIPVQAGYMIVDRKFGWQVNTGVSSDFFLRNTLVDKSGQRESFTQGAGEESPYRSVNWSGLFNTELSYKIGQHYRVSLVPGVRYTFNSIFKDPMPDDSGKPLFLDVGFRFKYLFE